MAMALQRDVRSAAQIAALKLGYKDLKPQQLSVVTAAARNRNCVTCSNTHIPAAQLPDANVPRPFQSANGLAAPDYDYGAPVLDLLLLLLQEYLSPPPPASRQFSE